MIPISNISVSCHSLTGTFFLESLLGKHSEILAHKAYIFKKTLLSIMSQMKWPDFQMLSLQWNSQYWILLNFKPLYKDCKKYTENWGSRRFI